MKFQVRANEDMASFQARVAQALEKLAAQSESKVLPAQAIGTARTKISHGLGRKPAGVRIGVPSVAATVYQPTTADANFVYLQASAACKADIEVW